MRFQLLLLLLRAGLMTCGGSRGDPVAQLMGVSTNAADIMIQRLRFMKLGEKRLLPSSSGKASPASGTASSANGASTVPVMPCDLPENANDDRCPPCPGDENPSDPTLIYVEKKYVKIKNPAGPCSGQTFIRDRGAQTCECQCDPFYGGGDPMNCSLNIREQGWHTMDCYNMSDSYLQTCNKISQTVCHPYGLSWKFECFRTCKALQGKRCIRDDYNRFCSHDPECPAMCASMMNAICDEQYQKTIVEGPKRAPDAASDTDADLSASAVQQMNDAKAASENLQRPVTASPLP